jgi:hypothetical protein
MDDFACHKPGVQPRRRGRRAQLVPEPVRVPQYEDLGPMPTDDALAMNDWTHRALGVALAQAIHDPEIDDDERHRRMTDIAGRMAALTPKSRLYAAENAVRGEVEKLAGDKGPEMERAANASPDPVDRPARRGTPLRGRPRKRGIG